MEVKLTVCDICEDPSRSTVTYTIKTVDGRTGRTDRCDEHNELLEEILAYADEATLVVKRAAKTAAASTATKRAQAKATAKRTQATTERSSDGPSTSTRRGKGIPVTSIDAIERSKRGRK